MGRSGEVSRDQMRLGMLEEVRRGKKRLGEVRGGWVGLGEV